MTVRVVTQGKRLALVLVKISPRRPPARRVRCMTIVTKGSR